MNALLQCELKTCYLLQNIIHHYVVFDEIVLIEISRVKTGRADKTRRSPGEKTMGDSESGAQKELQKRDQRKEKKGHNQASVSDRTPAGNLGASHSIDATAQVNFHDPCGSRDERSEY